MIARAEIHGGADDHGAAQNRRRAEGLMQKCQSRNGPDHRFHIEKDSGARGQHSRRSLAEKRSIVEQAMQSGACVAEIARQHGINDNLIFNWRKLYLAGRFGE